MAILEQRAVWRVIFLCLARAPGIRWSRARFPAGLLLFGWLLGASLGFAADGSREYDLKAVFLYNLASFVQWPESSFEKPETPFVLGVLGADPFGDVLDEIVAGEYVGTHPFEVRRLRRGDDLAGCHLIFLATSEHRTISDVLRVLQGRPVLTVADMPDFVEAGGMVAFEMSRNRLRLCVNPSAARAANLGFSSKLLEIAEIRDHPPVFSP